MLHTFVARFPLSWNFQCPDQLKSKSATRKNKPRVLLTSCNSDAYTRKRDRFFGSNSNTGSNGLMQFFPQFSWPADNLHRYLFDHVQWFRSSFLASHSGQVLKWTDFFVLIKLCVLLLCTFCAKWKTGLAYLGPFSRPLMWTVHFVSRKELPSLAQAEVGEKTRRIQIPSCALLCTWELKK